MDEGKRDEAADGPVVSGGGRSPSTLSPGQDAPSAGSGTTLGPLAPGQRWSAAREREVVPRLMRGEAAEPLSRELGPPVFKLEQWRRKAEAALEGALKEREADPADGQLAAAMRRIGEPSMENELLRARIGRPGPLARGRSRRWRRRPPRPPTAPAASRASAASGRWRGPLPTPRAERRAGADSTEPTVRPGRRGPKPAIADQDLPTAIRADLARSPWTGEGHRKVRARLRAMDGIRVPRRRLPRLMREHALLSPHRARPRPAAAAHDRRTITAAPNVMWATDATRITTVEDGKVWLFGVAEHRNAEPLGWHVARRGTRSEAIQAPGMAVRRQFGHLGAGAARGPALRHGHGGDFMAEVFQQRIRFWGMAPSYAFVGEPETDGVMERLFRTLKEQVVHGRVLRTIDEVRDAVRTFAARYNAEWLIEENGHRSPDAMRAARNEQTSRRAA